MVHEGATSPGGAFADMGLRVLTGAGPHNFVHGGSIRLVRCFLEDRGIAGLAERSTAFLAGRA